MKNLSVKLLALFLAVCQGAVFTSCKDDPEDQGGVPPTISVEKSHYNLATGSVDIVVKADVAPETNISVPVRCAGKAVEGTDYTLSAKQFVLKKGETSATITITRIEENIGENNVDLTINLEKGEGYNLGLTNYAEVTLLSKNGYIISFSNPSAKLTNEDSYFITLSNMTGNPYRPAAEETFDIEVDTENSTAVEGVNFSFPNGKTVKVPAKKSEGSFTVKVLKAEEGKDKLVLRIADKAGYGFGANPTMTVTVAGADNFTGTWAFKEITNLSLFSDYMEDISKAPKGSSEDHITFNGNNTDGYSFTPDFKGDFKNYFGTGERKIKYLGEVGKNFQEIMASYGRNIKVSQFSIPGINVKFSAKASEVRDAKVCFRLIEVEGQEILECTLDDFIPEPDEFAGQIYSFMGDMEWAPYRIHFTRVK